MIKNLFKGLIQIIKSVICKKKEYRLQFNCEDDGKWYVDFPNWPFDHHNLLMVLGADSLCEFLSNDGKHTYVSVIPSKKEKNYHGYAKLVQKEHSLRGGSFYQVTGIKGFNRKIWLCPVTLFVLGHYPKYIYIKKLRETATLNKQKKLPQATTYEQSCAGQWNVSFYIAGAV